MHFFEMIQPIIIMAIIVGIGYLISKKIKFTKDIRQFISFTVVNIAIPSVIMQSIFQSEIDQRMWEYFGIIILLGLFLNLTGLFLGYSVGKFMKYSVSESKQIAILSGCGNTGFFGIPVAYMLFGSTGGLYASIYDAVTVFTVFTIGVMLLQGTKFSLANFKHLINAPLITLAISLSIAFNGLSIPTLVFELTALLSSLAAPLAMIYIGMLFQVITREKWQKVKNNYLLLMASSTIIKLLILPFIAFIILNIIKIDSSLGKIIILQAGMPTFLLATVLFSQYIKSDTLGVVNIIITSAISLISLPFIIIVTMYFL